MCTLLRLFKLQMSQGAITLTHTINNEVHSQSGTKKECLIKKTLQMTTLDFCLFYIIIIVMDCFMPINKMMYS
jgi:hypothetical protein